MSKGFSIGVMVDSFKGSFAEGVAKAQKVGAQGIQLYVVNGENVYTSFNDEKVAAMKQLLAEHGLVISALCGDFGGHGFERTDENEWKVPASKAVAELAVKLGTKVVTTHIGCVPADTASKEYINMKNACREMGDFAEAIGVTFAIETGPEKAKTLAAFIRDVGSRGIGVNLDPANLVMVAGDDPVEAVKTLGEFIVHTHAKDGVMIQQTDPKRIYTFFAEGGIEDLRMADYFLEVPLGEGKVDFDRYLAALTEVGYHGFLTIERECGDDPYADIEKAVKFLKSKI